MGLPIALISIAKFLLLICAVVSLVRSKPRGMTASTLTSRATPVMVLVCLLALALSLFWTIAPAADALGSVAKYGKLLVLVLMMALIRTQREALYSLGWFVGGQFFLVLSSWALYMHLPVPWATSNMALTEYAVFSSYLDQGIMGSVLAAVCWHLRHLAPGRFGRHIAVGIAIVSVSNVLFVLSGRSGHVVAIALLSLAIMWQLPKRYRAVIVLLPFLLVTILFFSSSKVRDRLTMVSSEVQSYSSQEQSITSSGIRLGLWHNAIQMIAEHPFAGSGVGSWSTEYNRIQRTQNPVHKDISGNGNPHQEYLQWGVQLGVPGIALFLGLLLSILRDTLGMEKRFARAAQSTLVAFSVACLFNSSLYDGLIGDFFCVATGLLLALGAQYKKELTLPMNPSPRGQLAGP